MIIYSGFELVSRADETFYKNIETLESTRKISVLETKDEYDIPIKIYKDTRFIIYKYPHCTLFLTTNYVLLKTFQKGVPSLYRENTQDMILNMDIIFLQKKFKTFLCNTLGSKDFDKEKKDLFDIALATRVIDGYYQMNPIEIQFNRYEGFLTSEEVYDDYVYLVWRADKEYALTFNHVYSII
jgi:hypothetical protein